MSICRRYQAGFSLVEIMASLFILSVGLLGLAKFQGNIWYYVSIARQQAEAAIIGEQKLENLRSFEVINNTSGYTSYNSIATGSATTSGLDANYALAWTVTAATNPTYKTVDLTVSWTDRRSLTQSIALSTIIAGVDPQQSGMAMMNPGAGGF